MESKRETLPSPVIFDGNTITVQIMPASLESLTNTNNMGTIGHFNLLKPETFKNKQLTKEMLETIKNYSNKDAKLVLDCSGSCFTKNDLENLLKAANGNSHIKKWVFKKVGYLIPKDGFFTDGKVFYEVLADCLKSSRYVTSLHVANCFYHITVHNALDLLKYISDALVEKEKITPLKALFLVEKELSSGLNKYDFREIMSAPLGMEYLVKILEKTSLKSLSLNHFYFGVQYNLDSSDAYSATKLFFAALPNSQLEHLHIKKITIGLLSSSAEKFVSTLMDKLCKSITDCTHLKEVSVKKWDYQVYKEPNYFAPYEITTRYDTSTLNLICVSKLTAAIKTVSTRPPLTKGSRPAVKHSSEEGLELRLFTPHGTKLDKDKKIAPFVQITKSILNEQFTRLQKDFSSYSNEVLLQEIKKWIRFAIQYQQGKSSNRSSMGAFFKNKDSSLALEVRGISIALLKDMQTNIRITIKAIREIQDYKVANEKIKELFIGPANLKLQECIKKFESPTIRGIVLNQMSALLESATKRYFSEESDKILLREKSTLAI